MNRRRAIADTLAGGIITLCVVVSFYAQYPAQVKIFGTIVLTTLVITKGLNLFFGPGSNE